MNLYISVAPIIRSVIGYRPTISILSYRNRFSKPIYIGKDYVHTHQRIVTAISHAMCVHGVASRLVLMQEIVQYGRETKKVTYLELVYSMKGYMHVCVLYVLVGVFLRRVTPA